MMKKLVGALFVSAAAAFVSMPTPDASAGAKKKTATIEIIESKDGKYRFTVRDAEGKYLGGSATGYATEKAAKTAVEDLKKALESATYVSKKAEEPKKDKE
jgi:uncharacterized protein YegP (UPF0339 family)